MKAWFLLWVWVLGAGSAWAQGSRGVRLDFRFSRVILTSGDTLAGPVSVHLGTDLLYLALPDGQVRTLVPAMVLAFAVQGEMPIINGLLPVNTPSKDPTVVRLFRTILWQPERLDQRPEPTFFEQLSEGPVLLLRRQAVVPRQVALNMTGASPSGGLSRGMGPAPSKALLPTQMPVSYRTINEIQDVFYLAWATGEVHLLRNPRKDVLAAFPEHARQLQAYAKMQSLGYTSAFELHELVNYANSLTLTVAP